MAVEGAAKVIKYLMFFFNFVLFLTGLAIIIAGALVFTQYNDYVAFTKSLGTAIPIFLLVVGVFVLFTGFLGCWGSIRENYCMVFVFAIIILILLIAEIGGGIAGYVLRDQINDNIEDKMNETLYGYNQTANKKLFDNLQQELKCCGVNNYTDWFDYFQEEEVPDSCCKNESTSCGDIGFKSTDIYMDGCWSTLYDLLEKNIIIIGAIAFAVALIQIFGVVCACCLMKNIKGEYEVV